MITKLQTSLKEAMTSKNAPRVSVLRMALAALTNEAISKGGGYALNNEEIQTVLMKLVRSRQDSIECFLKGGRQDLVDVETAEIKVLEEFLPRQISDQELETSIQAIIGSIGASNRKDMGRVMAHLKTSLGNTYDAKKASTLVTSLLN